MNIDEAKAKLQEEKERLERELGQMGDPGRGSDQHISVGPRSEQSADLNETADRFEELGEKVALEGTLEERLANVEKALAAIDGGTYGKCEASGEPHDIPEGRMNANPAATTCLDHTDA